MTQAFEDYAASRPGPTLPKSYRDNTGYIGTAIAIMLVHDAWIAEHAKMRDKIGYEIEKRQEVTPSTTSSQPNSPLIPAGDGGKLPIDMEHDL